MPIVKRFALMPVMVVAVFLAIEYPASAAGEPDNQIEKFFGGFSQNTKPPELARPKVVKKIRTARARKPVTVKSVTAADIRQSVRDVLLNDPAMLRNTIADLIRNDPEIKRALSPKEASQPVAPVQTAPSANAAVGVADAKAIELIVRNYLVANPELLEEMTAELQKRQSVAEAAKHKAAVEKHSDAIFKSPRGVIVGNRDGDVNFVEFFDYNCGYCKKAMIDMLDLMKADPKLRVVLKEFPVLGPGSMEAAQVAVAVRMQDPTGKKYLDFHQKLLNSRGQADKARALAAAKDAGLDMAKLEKDLTSPEIRATLEENFKIAEDMGLNGTPSYVIGKDVVVGAVGIEGLSKKISEARCGKATC